MKDRYLPLFATISVFVALYVAGGLFYPRIFSTLVFGHLLADNAFIILAAIGVTFVIISGGIDLSIGSMIGFVGVVMANMDAAGWDPIVVIFIVLAFGILYGAFQGFLIDFCEIQPFIVTLSGLFLLRGASFMVNLDSVPLRNYFVSWFNNIYLDLPGGGFLTGGALVMLAMLVVAIIIAHFTRFGTNVYAIGGDKTSAVLMGVPMRKTTVMIYALAGFYSAIAGVIYAMNTSSGYPLAGMTLELSAIAASVLGGTMLTGGVGMVFGALFGGMILALISTIIIFNGTLNGAWILIATGFLLFLFIVIQRWVVSSFSSAGKTS